MHYQNDWHKSENYKHLLKARTQGNSILKPCLGESESAWHFRKVLLIITTIEIHILWPRNVSLQIWSAEIGDLGFKDIQQDDMREVDA